MKMMELLKRMTEWFWGRQKEPRLSKARVIEIAKIAVEEKKWKWREPVVISFHDGRKSCFWEIWTNAHYRGGNLKIYIDDQTGEVLKMWSLPR